MTTPLGYRRWAVSEGYIPGWSTGRLPEMESHETVCVLNAGGADAHLVLTVYFPDREPLGPFRILVPARRTRHVRLNELTDPGRIPMAHDYAYVVESDVPVVVQHTRLDSRQSENALFSIVAFVQDS